MKRAGGLYEQILLPDNLRLAFRKAVRGKRDREEVKRFQEQLSDNIETLREGLAAGDPDIGDYRYFQVFDPKPRRICAAVFPERVLHHAIMNVCEPALEHYAIFDSYACRPGKGNLAALKRAQQFVRENAWYLKLDIRKYFDSIDHEIMMRLLSRRFREKRLLRLFARILDTYEIEPGKGLPIGNLISQHLANFYMGIFDHWVKEDLRCRAYLRFMDDFALLSPDKRTLSEALTRIQTYLAEVLKLTVKENIQLNQSQKGMPFLGFRIFPEAIRLSPRTRRRFVKRYRAYERKRICGTWTEAEAADRMTALFAHVSQADSLRFRQKTIKQFGVSS